jgi:hypothetical protein
MLRSAFSEFLCRASVLSIVLGCGVPAFGSFGAFGSKDSVPDWVRAAAAQPLKTYSPETEAVVLLDDRTVTVAADGKAVERRRHVVKILRPKGRDDGYVGVYFDKDSKILSLHVWSIGPDGHEYEVKDKEMADAGLPGEGGQLYQDVRVRMVNPPGRDPGGVVAYESEQRVEPYLHEATWEFQGGIPRVNRWRRDVSARPSFCCA